MVIRILSFILLDSGVEQDETGQAQEGHQAQTGYSPLLPFHKSYSRLVFTTLL